jgi:hypothetical protein
MKPIPSDPMARANLMIECICLDALETGSFRYSARADVVTHLSRAMPSARSGALRAEPPSASQAKPPAAIARGRRV